MKLRGLTLVEALKHNKPMKRSIDYHWRDVTSGTIAVSADDAAATDWEIKPDPFRARVYVSPDRKQITFESVKADWNWEAYNVVEEGT